MIRGVASFSALNTAHAISGPKRHLWLVASEGKGMPGRKREEDLDLTDEQAAGELIEVVNDLHDRLQQESKLRVELAAFAAFLEQRQASPE
jgi:hypothetical protein